MEANTIVDMAYAFVETEVMVAAHEIGLFQVVSSTPMSASEIAKAVNCPDTHMEELCDAVVNLGLLTKNNKGAYTANAASKKHMVQQGTGRDAVFLGDWLMFLKMVFTADITQAVKSGSFNYQEKDKDVFVKFEKKENVRKVFQAGMAAVAKTATFLTTAFDVSSYKTYVDLGGGTGTYARAMMNSYPDMKVTLCDLPRVIETAKSLPVNQNTNLNYQPADFLKDDLPKADLYSTNHVLHDWNDESCHIILTAVHKALNKGGAIIVLDSIFNDDKVGPSKVNLTEMGQIAHHEGKHRTKAEFAAILKKAGFGDVIEQKYTGFGFYDGLMAKKI